MNRSEHMQWCKTRALEYLETGDTYQALASITSDLNKHPETATSDYRMICAMGMDYVDSTEDMRKFINDFS